MSRILSKGQHISTIVRDRTGIIFEGLVGSLTSFNEEGEFDVLPLHSNFISIIQNQLTLRQKGEVVKSIEFQTGILTVRDDAAEVFLGILSR